MAASMKNVVWNFSRFQLAEMCLRQSPRLASTTASGTAKSVKTNKKATKEASPEPVPEAPKPAPSESAPYTYEVPRYDDWLFYNLESDMIKYRQPQPAPGKP